MKKAFKWALLVFGAFTVLFLAAVIAIALFFDIQGLKPHIERQLFETTGRPVTLRGDLKLSIYPWVGLSLSDLSIGNPSGFEEKDFLILKSLEVRVKLLPLFRREIQIKHFIATSPRIILVKNATGRFNWSDWRPSKENTVQSVQGEQTAPHRTAFSPKNLFNSKFWPRSFHAGTLSVLNGSILWIDHLQKKDRQISEIDIHIKDASLTRPIDIRFACRLDSYPLTGQGAIGPLDRAITGDSLPLDLTLRLLDQLDMNLTGRIDRIWTGPFFNCAIQVQPFSPRHFMTAIKQDFPFDFKDPGAFRQLALKADLGGVVSNLTLENGALQMDGTAMKFSLSLRRHPRFQVSFDADMDTFDLNRYLPSTDRKKNPANRGRIFADLLRQPAIAGTLRIKSVNIGKNRLANIHLNAGGSMGNYTLRFIKMDLMKGKGSGTFRFNLNKAKPAFKLKGLLKGFESDLLATSLQQQKRIKGPMDISADITTSGMTLPEWSRNLNGTVAVKANRLSLSGLDIDAILKKYEETQNFGLIGIGSFFIIGPFGPLLAAAYENVDAALAVGTIGEGESLIKTLISDWQIQNGIASARDVAFSTAQNRVAVSGKINIAAQKFNNLTFASIDTDGCMKFSQTIHGPFHQPQIEKSDFVTKHIFGPFQSLYRKTRKLAGGGCEPFYSGRVPHPDR
ncbi:MAG: AsmA family protein [Desulfobacterales bacterium]|nr:AsmA family protein [Desulfobacterales bacterium]